MFSDRLKNLLFFVVLFLCIFALFLLLDPHGDLGKKFKFALILAALPVGWLRLRQLKSDQTKSGLSEDEFLLKKAGGRLQLMSQASTVKAIGWLFIALPIAMALTLMIIMKSLDLTLVVVLVFIGILCVPFGVHCLRTAERNRWAAIRGATKRVVE
jgi:hypothetical protein